ncbi:MAG: enoyl-CoA hydratase/isomerase family protein, partial [Hyphomicrobiales bacterium]|nr:enoyl-CoA hydratase/isomerase family protein [Hyphomicrobiales bacterium]
MSGRVEIRREGAVLVLAMDRPGKRNALTGAMYGAMIEAMEAAEKDAAVGALLVEGRDGVFTAGNDIADFLAGMAEGSEPPPLAFIRLLARREKPMVAAVDGPAVGIGTTLCLHCDFVHATARATFRTPFVDLALVPEAGSSLLLPLRVGQAAANSMLMLGESVDGLRARAIGLVDRIDEPDALATA